MGEIPRSRADATTPLKTVRPDAMSPVRDVRGDPKQHNEFKKAQQQDSSRPSSVVVGLQLLHPPSDCTENNRGMRVQVLDAIVTCLETKRPSWQKARILHLSSQLEESMFCSGGSMAEYGDKSTLPARINRHCLLLATRKTASNQSAGAAAVAPNNVAACGTISPPLPLPPPPAATASANPSLSSNPLHPRGVFIQHAEEDGGNWAVAPPACGVKTGAVFGWQGGRGGASGTRVEKAVEGREGGVLSEASSHAGRTTAVTPPPPPPLPPPPSHVSLRQEPRAMTLPGGVVAPRSHARGVDIDLDDGDDCGGASGGGGGGGGGYSDTAERAMKSVMDEENSPDVGGFFRGEKGDEPAPLSLTSGNVVAWRSSDVGGMFYGGAGGGGALGGQGGDEHAEAMAEVVGTALRAEEGGEGAEEEGPRGPRVVSEALSEGAVEAKADAAKEEEVKQHALRLLQCRLLLLTHASSCSEAGGSCQLSPLCDSVRQLLVHMPTCADGKTCDFAHCASSKAVLQHQHLCDDSGCQLCGSVRALSQKCFWANARHAHKRRLQESYEMRRLKRQSEGKSVALPRKPQTERAKNGRETCSGLDEAGNDLGDISLGFFLRQVKAAKARKISQENTEISQENDGGHRTTSTPAPSGGGSCSLLPPPPPDVHPNPDPQQQQPQPPPGHELRDATVAATANVFAPPTPTTIMPSCSTVPPLSSSSSDAVGGGGGGGGGGYGDGGPKKRGRVCVVERVGGGLSTPCKSWNSMTVTPILFAPRSVAPLPAPAATMAATAAASGARVVGLGAGHSGRYKDKDDDENTNDREEEEMSGGGAEARAVRAYSGEARGPTARGGGVTVVIPPPGLVVGHLRSPSEVMLGDIAESLADTTRKHSFARMQSVQAFLDEHEELRASASFGDVSAMVEQWMSLEDGMGDDEHLGLTSAFSF